MTSSDPMPFILRRLAFPVLLAALAAPSVLCAQAGFTAQVRRPTQNPQTHTYVAQWLQSSRMLELTAQGINEAFALPEPASIVGLECGQENAFWDPNQRAVFICYELLHSIFEEFRYDGLSTDQFGTAVASTSTFVLFHEIGHALIDILDLPTTGREEDVVDQFATMALADEGDGTMAYWAAQYWLQRNDFGDTGLFKFDATPYSDEHGFDEQRFYNILCWTYGRDPGTRGFVLNMLPQERAVRCPSEYARMAGAWEALLAGHLRTAEAHQEPTRPRRAIGSSARLSGVWHYREILGRRRTSIYCENNGTYDFQQSARAVGGRYRQTGWCDIGGQRVDNPGEGEITRGGASGEDLEFTIENCSYSGHFIQPDEIEGEIACMLDLGNGDEQVTGTWRATRASR